MPVSASFTPNSPSLVVRPRLVVSRQVDTSWQYHGEKPFEQLVAEAFDGPVLRLTRRIKLLEKADERHIRRGDAIDLIETTRRALEKKHSVRPPSRGSIFAKHFVAFAAAYAVVAMTWCLLIEAY
jgi:hypothetical protein